jgi:hypothetical protein
MCTTRLTVLAVAVATAAVATPADAGTLRGSNNGLRVKVGVNAQGGAKRAVFTYRARCETPRTTFRDSTVVDLGGRARFGGTGSYTVRQSGGIRIRVRVRSSGRRVSRHRWTGTFSSSAVARRGGRVIDRCRLRKRRWRASMPRVRLSMSSDNGEYILQGRSYTYATPGDNIGVDGNRRFISVQAGPWTLEIQAPSGRSLRRGRFRGARRYPFNDNRPGLTVSGDGRGCNEVTGEFTIRSSSFDRRGRLRAIDVSFVHNCEGGERALRGTFTYRR